MFKRRKPEEPPAPASRGHVIAAGPELPLQARLEAREAADATVVMSGAAEAAARPVPDLAEIPPLQSLPQPTPVAPMPPKLKEPMRMSQAPLKPTPISPTMSMPQGLSRTTPLAPARTSMQPGERRTLVVGRGISVKGTIEDAERLVVEGMVEASSLNAQELQIAQGGVLKGQVEVEDAEISGLMDGILTVQGSLVLRGTGQVIGEARCRRLQVEDGGQLSGKISMISEPASVASIPAEPEPTPSIPAYARSDG